ncbi:MAG: tripartite tricarboxylate transporter TctB family protein [Candidatus Heteroscillospira sp.]
MLNKYRDVICGVVIMICAVILFIATFSIKSLLGMNPGPEFMPRVASILLFLVALGITLEGLQNVKHHVAEEVSEEEKGYRKAGNRKVLYSAILIGFYVFSLETLGFVISTLIYEFCQMIVLTPLGKKKNYLLFGIITVVSTVFFYIVFTRFLYLMLPAGLLRYVGL